MGWNNDTVREEERRTIRKFLNDNREVFDGLVLDFGSGKEPYRDVVESRGAKYVPYDRVTNPGSVAVMDVGPDLPLERDWDVVMFTQVLQYIPPHELGKLFRRFRISLGEQQGRLVGTYATCWDEVEQTDLCRLTKAGVEYLLRNAGFVVEVHERRFAIELGGFRLPIGGGFVARCG